MWVTACRSVAYQPGMVAAMTRFRPAALAAVTLLAVGSCSSTPTAPAGGVANPGTATTATGPTVAAIMPTTVATSTALTFPPENVGELARAIYVPRAHTSSLWQAPAKGRSYVVHAACSASGPGASVTYQVLDARPSTPETQRTLTSGEVPCDGTVTADGASPLVGNVISIDLTKISERVTRAYAVIVPE